MGSHATPIDASGQVEGRRHRGGTSFHILTADFMEVKKMNPKTGIAATVSWS